MDARRLRRGCCPTTRMAFRLVIEVAASLIAKSGALRRSAPICRAGDPTPRSTTITRCPATTSRRLLARQHPRRNPVSNRNPSDAARHEVGDQAPPAALITQYPPGQLPVYDLVHLQAGVPTAPGRLVRLTRKQHIQIHQHIHRRLNLPHHETQVSVHLQRHQSTYVRGWTLERRACRSGAPVRLVMARGCSTGGFERRPPRHVGQLVVIRGAAVRSANRRRTQVAVVERPGVGS